MNVLKRDNLLFAFFILLSSALFFLDFKGYLAKQKNILLRLTAPVSQNLYTWKGGSWYLPFLKESQGQIDLLTKENSFLISQISLLKDVEKENQEFRRLLGTNLPPSWKIYIGEVIGNNGDFLTVSTEAEVAKDTLVILPKNNESDGFQRLIGIYLGKVETNGNYTRVLLPTSPMSKLEVVVRSKDTFEQTASGILEGKGGHVLLGQVLSSENLNAGDWILTQAKGDIRSELLVGRITKEISDKNLTFKKAEADLVINFDKLNKVFFVIK